MAVDEGTGTLGSEGADDAVDAAVEHAEGTDGGQPEGQQSIEELQAQLREERAARLAYERMLGQRGEPAGGDDDPPTRPDPRAAMDQQMFDNELAEAEAQVRMLAGRKDAASIYALKQAEAYRSQIAALKDATGRALTLMWDRIQTMEVPQESRDAFDEFYQSNRGAFTSKAAAVKMWTSMQKAQARATTPTTPTTPAARPSPTTARRPMVDTTVRPVPSREAAARTMTGEQFDTEIESLRKAGRYDEARQLQARYDANEIVITD